MIKNIVLLGHGAGIKFIIQSLLDNPKLGFKVVAVVTHPYAEHKSDLEMIKSRFEMYGEYGYNVFNVKLDFNIDIFEAIDVNSIEIIDLIKGYKPEYVISVSCRNIIKSNFLNEFNGSVLNIHTTPLPKYRGGASDSWMILNGEWGNELYGCMHFIDTGIDSGDIVAKSFYTVPNKCYPIQLYKVRLDTFKMLILVGLKNLSNNSFVAEKQNIEEMTVFPRLKTKIDGRLNFEKYNGEELEKLIYAFGYPHEGSFCYCGVDKVNILEAEFNRGKGFHPKCYGLIFGKDSNSNYKVAVNGGYILIKKIEINSHEVEQKNIFRLGKFLN
ncbi:formyltransferase family protein [Aquirufa antheringensis]